MKAVDGRYPLYGQVDLAPQQALAAALAPQEDAQGTIWGAVIEAGLLQRLGLSLGDKVRVGEARFRITALLQHEPDRVTRGLILGPPFITSAEALGASGLNQPGSLIHHHYRLRLPAGENIADSLAPGDHIQQLEGRLPVAEIEFETVGFLF